MTNKIIFLCSLLVTPYAAFGMEESSTTYVSWCNSRDITLMKELPISQQVGLFSNKIYKPTIRAKLNCGAVRDDNKKLNFTAHYNERTKIAIIYYPDHHENLVVERVKLYDNPNGYILQSPDRYIFICVEKGSLRYGYKINAVTTESKLSYLDKATKLKKDKSDWPALIGCFIGGSIFTAGVMFIWFIKNFRYNK